MKRLLLLALGCCAFAGQVHAAEPDVLTLDEALRLARANHPQLHASRAQTEASQARVAEAKAPLLPQVSGMLPISKELTIKRPRQGLANRGSRPPPQAGIRVRTTALA